jgi:hypothetical protein
MLCTLGWKLGGAVLLQAVRQPTDASVYAPQHVTPIKEFVSVKCVNTAENM